MLELRPRLILTRADHLVEELSEHEDDAPYIPVRADSFDRLCTGLGNMLPYTESPLEHHRSSHRYPLGVLLIALAHLSPSWIAITHSEV